MDGTNNNSPHQHDTTNEDEMSASDNGPYQNDIISHDETAGVEIQNYNDDKIAGVTTKEDDETTGVAIHNHNKTTEMAIQDTTTDIGPEYNINTHDTEIAMELNAANMHNMGVYNL